MEMLSVLSSDPPSLVVVSVVAGCALFSTLLLLLLLRHVLCCHWRHKHAPSPVDSVEMTAPGSTSGSPSRTLPLMRYSSDCLPKGAARVALSGGRRQRGVTCGCGEGSCAHQDAQEHHSRAGSKCSRDMRLLHATAVRSGHHDDLSLPSSLRGPKHVSEEISLPICAPKRDSRRQCDQEHAAAAAYGDGGGGGGGGDYDEESSSLSDWDFDEDEVVLSRSCEEGKSDASGGAPSSSGARAKLETRRPGVHALHGGMGGAEKSYRSARGFYRGSTEKRDSVITHDVGVDEEGTLTATGGREEPHIPHLHLDTLNEVDDCGSPGSPGILPPLARKQLLLSIMLDLSRSLTTPCVALHYTGPRELLSLVEETLNCISFTRTEKLKFVWNSPHLLGKPAAQQSILDGVLLAVQRLLHGIFEMQHQEAAEVLRPHRRHPFSIPTHFFLAEPLEVVLDRGQQASSTAATTQGMRSFKGRCPEEDLALTLDPLLAPKTTVTTPSPSNGGVGYAGTPRRSSLHTSVLSAPTLGLRSSGGDGDLSCISMSVPSTPCAAASRQFPSSSSSSSSSSVHTSCCSPAALYPEGCTERGQSPPPPPQPLHPHAMDPSFLSPPCTPPLQAMGAGSGNMSPHLVLSPSRGRSASISCLDAATTVGRRRQSIACMPQCLLVEEGQQQQSPGEVRIPSLDTSSLLLRHVSPRVGSPVSAGRDTASLLECYQENLICAPPSPSPRCPQGFPVAQALDSGGSPEEGAPYPGMEICTVRTASGIVVSMPREKFTGVGSILSVERIPDSPDPLPVRSPPSR